MEIITKSAEETERAGFILAEESKKQPLLNHAFTVALFGDLGSGKTTFIKGFAAGFGVEEDISSPTFVIQKDFPLTLKNFKHFFHIDSYRLNNPEELLELGFDDIIKNAENVVTIEWADKVEGILPRNILKIDFFNLGKNQRTIIIS
jgi:tRNA threonylcarbamoyladenosine biosynthesis protein TsaE